MLLMQKHISGSRTNLLELCYGDWINHVWGEGDICGSFWGSLSQAPLSSPLDVKYCDQCVSLSVCLFVCLSLCFTGSMQATHTPVFRCKVARFCD